MDVVFLAYCNLKLSVFSSFIVISLVLVNLVVFGSLYRILEMKMDAMLFFIAIFRNCGVRVIIKIFCLFCVFVVRRIKRIYFSYYCSESYCKLFNSFIRDSTSFIA